MMVDATERFDGGGSRDGAHAAAAAAAATPRRGKGVLGYMQRAWLTCEARLNDVNERYTFELNPEYRLKLRKR